MFKSLHKKILSGFLLVIGLMGVISVWAVFNLSNIQDTTTATLQTRFEILSALNTLDTAARHLRASATRLLLTPDDPYVTARFHSSETATASALSRISTGASPLASNAALYRSFYGIAHLTTEIENELNYQLLPASEPALPKTENDQAALTRARNEIFLSEIDPLFDSLDARISYVQNGYVTSLGSLSKVAQQEGDRIRTEVLLLGALVLILCIVFSIRFADVLVKPIVELTAKTKRITAGELNQLVIPRTNDEVGRLGEQFNAMAAKLSEFEELNLKKILEEKAISESIVQSMDDALILIDRFGTVLSINRSAQDLFRLTNVEGRNCLDVARGIPALESLCFAALKGTWKDRNRLEIVEHSNAGAFQGSAGNDRLYLTRDIIPIQSGGDSKPGDSKGSRGDSLGTVAFLLLLRDVTQSHELEKMRSDFVGMVSHELRTPLTAIRMSIDLLAEPTLGPLTEVQEQFVQAIREESERLLRIVNDLMDLAKIESGKFEVKPSDIELASFFEHLLVPFIAAAQEAGIAITTELDPSASSVSADPDRLKQVFVNLISNAMRYTPSGGQITIGVRFPSKENRGKPEDQEGFAKFFVRDTGSGIPSEFIPKIFQRFAIRSQDVKAGTGLGLAIAKEIVQAHGGSIQVTSAMGKGSEFSFSIPLSAIKAPAASPSKSTGPAPLQSGPGKAEPIFVRT